MSCTPVALDKNRHASLTFSPLQDFSFSAAMDVMPLLAFEPRQAARAFAVVFPVPGSAMPHALLGLNGRNNFLDAQGRWNAPYLPLYAANYPFSLIDVSEQERPDGAKVILALDESAPHFRQPDGQPLYEKNGEPTQTLQSITTALATQYERHKAYSPALSELAMSGVLKEQNITLQQENGPARAVKNLRVADREAVRALSSDVLNRWDVIGLKGLLKDHWLSLRHLETLLDIMQNSGSEAPKAS